MVKRMESEAPQGNVERLRPILGAIAFGLVFSFGLGNGLPAHILWRVSPATFKGDGVVNHIPFAGSRGPSGSRTGVGQSKLVLGAVGSENPAMTITGTRFTAFSAEARKGQQ